jgi:hypothetical protein
MSDRKTCYGAYLYPPLFFEKIPLSFKEIFDQTIPPYVPIEKPIHSFQFLNYEVSIDSAGFVWTDQTDKEVSEAILNSIFLSATLLKGYGVRSVNQEELTSVSINSATNEARIAYIVIINERGWLHNFPEMRREFMKNEKPVILNQDEFQVILELAQMIFRSKFKTTILTFYECFTMRDRCNFTGSFLFGWMTIESYLNHKLEAFLLSKDVSQNKIDQLKKRLSAEEKIDNLKDNYVLLGSRAASLHSQRTIRNEILHKQRKATEVESRGCIEVATSIMWELFRMEQDIDYGMYFNKMETIRQKQDPT